MSKIIVENLNLSYPIYGAGTRSFKRHLIEIGTGGKLSQKGKLPVVEALRDISFTLQEGDRLGLVGHNGAGKSTLLRVLAGIYQTESGSVEVTGQVSALLDVNLGMEQEATGYDNIKLRRLILGLPKKQAAQMQADIEEFSELGDFLAMPVKTYSAGMRVRLAFGLSTVIKPDILLVDEVIGAGDAHFMEKAKKRMESFVQDSDIFVLSSHDNEVIRRFCNKVMWLEHGKIKAYGNAHEVLTDYEKSR